MQIGEIKASRGWLVFVIIVSIAILIGSICYWSWLSKDLANGDAVRNIALSIGGVWAIYAVFLAAMRVNIMQEQQVSEGLARAAEQLSSESMSIRILAILSLGKVALEMDKQTCQDAIKVLCVYIREKRPADESDALPVTEDIQEIIDVLSEVQSRTRWEVAINLSGINLAHVNLAGVNFQGVDLSGASLSGASLSGASLSGANLSGANLSNADLSAVEGLDMAENLETIENPPPEILAEIERREREG